MYQHDVLPFLVEALKVAAGQNFSVDDSIKPLVAYLAANLHESAFLFHFLWIHIQINTYSPHSVYHSN